MDFPIDGAIRLEQIVTVTVESFVNRDSPLKSYHVNYGSDGKSKLKNGESLDGSPGGYVFGIHVRYWNHGMMHQNNRRHE